jgi:hypothetical protein
MYLCWEGNKKLNSLKPNIMENTQYAVVTDARENHAGLGTFSTEIEANTAITQYYANGGTHEDPYASLIAVVVDAGALV